MTGGAASFPEVVFLRRGDGTGYGFFYHGAADFLHAANSFSGPVLRSFDGEPMPGQPDPQDHLKTAISTFIGQAFDRAVPEEVGAEGVSRAVAAAIRQVFKGPIPRVVLIERKDGKLAVRPGIEFMKHPGHPLAVVVDADAHGGEARFFKTPEDYRKVGETPANARCWLPQIVYRLYAKTSSVVAGKPVVDRASGKTSVEFRAITFGMKAPLVERQG